MTPLRFDAITQGYPQLTLAVVGDFCLDRYLEIDPARPETSLETGLPVHNVVNVRAQPGGAGTILNNLVALGVGSLYAVGFAGDDGEGFELRRALAARRGVRLDHFVQTPERRTFTYCKPLVVEPGKPPRELNRLDSKNWTPTPPAVEERMVDAVGRLARTANAFILLSQVDVPETGVLTRGVLNAIKTLTENEPRLTILADSRRGLADFPPVGFKMNSAELARLVGSPVALSPEAAKEAAAAIARRHHRYVFGTLAENGILGAGPDGRVEHVPVLPVRGPIDIVGAGDAVTANLTTALAVGATLRETLELANAAASVVVHQLGTTGTATTDQIREALFGGAAESAGPAR